MIDVLSKEDDLFVGELNALNIGIRRSKRGSHDVRAVACPGYLVGL